MNKSIIGILVILVLALAGWIVSDKLFSDKTNTAQPLTAPLAVNDNGDLKELISAVRDNAASVQDSLNSITGEIDDISERLSNLEEQGDEADLPNREPQPDPFAGLTDEEQKRLAEEQMRLYFADVEQAFVSQGVDEAWSAKADYDINQLFESNQFGESTGAILTNVECRASTCKLQVQLEEGNDQAELEDDLVFSLGAKGFKSIKGFRNKEAGENARTFYAGDVEAMPQSVPRASSVQSNKSGSSN